jgi:MFS family permease
MYNSVGVYTTAPVSGRLVDAKGPRIPLAMGLVFLLTGYLGIKAIYDAGSGERISTFTFVVLILCAFITGVGGNGGLSGSVNSVAKSFPDKFVRICSTFGKKSLHEYFSVQQPLE